MMEKMMNAMKNRAISKNSFLEKNSLFFSEVTSCRIRSFSGIFRGSPGKKERGTALAVLLMSSAAFLGCLGGDDGKDGRNGVNGTNGTNASIQTAAEPAGENCANGGIKIEVLLDGVVQPEQTQYICNGNDGTGSGSGTSGTSASVRTSAEPAGTNCENGGIKVEVLLDGEVQDEQTQYICNGIDGTAGTNGANATIQTAPEPAGTNCPKGGIKVEVLLDGVVQNAQTQYICNGNDGEGTEGPAGLDGCNASMHRDASGACVPNPEGFVYIPAGSMTLTHGTWEYTTGTTLNMDAFFLKKTPVTVLEFMACVEAGACTSENYFTASQQPYWTCNYERGDAWYNHPMNCVNQAAAVEYCTWAGGRIPTEWEWEYAATHNGTEHLNTLYPFGNTIKHCENANYKGSGASPYCNGHVESASLVGTSPVGMYNGNSPLGLVDMAGNIGEWTSSSIDSNGTHVAVRGGSYFWTEERLAVTDRASVSPEDKYHMFGIRCVIDP